MPTLTHKLPRACKLAALSATLALTSPASATWSILITDTRTGEIVLGSATCITSFDLAQETPLVLTGIGAITAQSSVDSGGTNRMFIRDRLLEGQPLSQILTELQTFDPGHNNRQYGMIKTNGDVLTFSGIDNANWAGGTTGRIEQGRPGPQDDIVYTVQGNILSGPNVVDDAVQAIINTNTDLPGKLMAGMYAARIAGGDGRCSCSNANPTGCGSPPPTPFKSAHVGYMIGSRADDTDSIRAFYQLPVPQSATSTSLTQLNHNTFATADTAGNIHLYTNATNTNDQTAHLNFLQTIETNIPNLTKLAAADLDHNGLNDLIALAGNTTVVLIPQSASNTFDPPLEVNFPIPITDLDTLPSSNDPGDHVLVTNSKYAFLYSFEDNTLVPTTGVQSPGPNAQSFFIQDLNNDTLQDLVILSPSTQTAFLHHSLQDGLYSVTPQSIPNLSPNPSSLRATDINNDGLTDILIATASVINTFINTGTPEAPTFAPKVSSSIPAPAVDFHITDLNNDTIQDAIVLYQSGPNLRYYLGDNAGTFTETDRTRIGGTPTQSLLTDLNNDGDMDLITNASDQLLIYDNLQNATVQRQTGFARGDKFMFINIANQGSAAPDPIDQMLTRFDDFRATLTNLPDAVQTTVTQPSRILIDDPGATPKLRIHLKDYQQQTLALPATFTLEFNPTNLTPGLPQLVAPGIYDIPLTALSQNNASPGNHTLKIKATANNHTVTLMPALTISTTNNLADYNADDTLNFLDISIFISHLSAHNPIADLNNDTLFDHADVTTFLNAYKAAP
tara:strand:- start:1452 stop:3821 length:2370 start_codon:yes stop_codon:yes gene_type:complete